tara:strand:+ start:229 stop:504 length:276 start_codon:yes stop_codon:yes gene_type:complete
VKRFLWFRKILFAIASLIIAFILFFHVNVTQAKGKKARFYDFSDQLINGEIKKPAAIYMESRARAKFAKLLRLKKSFREALIKTNQDPILK